MKPACPNCEALAERARKKSNAWYALNSAKVQAKRRKRYRDRKLRKQYSAVELREIVKGYDVPPTKEGVKSYKCDLTAAEDKSLNACVRRRGLLKVRTWRGWELAA